MTNKENKYKDFTLDYGGAGYYYASFTDDPERGTPFIVRASNDNQAWEKLKSMIDQESCSTCGKYMGDEETNYGTEDILTCIHCYTDAQDIDNGRDFSDYSDSEGGEVVFHN